VFHELILGRLGKGSLRAYLCDGIGADQSLEITGYAGGVIFLLFLFTCVPSRDRARARGPSGPNCPYRPPRVKILFYLRKTYIHHVFEQGCRVDLASFLCLADYIHPQWPPRNMSSPRRCGPPVALNQPPSP